MKPQTTKEQRDAARVLVGEAVMALRKGAEEWNYPSWDEVADQLPATVQALVADAGALEEALEALRLTDGFLNMIASQHENPENEHQEGPQADCDKVVCVIAAKLWPDVRKALGQGEE